MSKALIISDIHLHRWQYGSTVTEQGYNSRLVDQIQYLATLPYSVDEDIKHIICLGDLFHTNQTVHAEVLQLASSVMEYYANADIKFHCLVGNHDMASRDGTIHSLDWLKPYGTVINTHMVFSIEGRQISALPYTEDIRKLEQFFVPSMNSELVLLHQGVNLHENRGSAWVLNEIFKKEMVPDHVKRVLTGHYHKPCDEGKISIVGSPMQHNWSDYDDAARGAILLDLDSLEIERVENKFSPKFLKVDWNEPEGVDNCFVKIANCPKDKMEKTREDLFINGALSVEFELPASATVNNNCTKPVFSTLDAIISEYDSTIDGRKLEVGHQVREQKYEAPQL